MLRHMVALRYAEGTDQAVKDDLMADLAALKGRIDGICDFQVRENVSVEVEMVRGFKDLFWFDFANAAVRDAYLVDEVHQAIGARLVETLKGGADGVFVLDFAV